MVRWSRMKTRSTSLRIAGAVWRPLNGQFGLSFRWLSGLKSLSAFGAEYRQYRSLNATSEFTLRGGDICPQLTDRTSATPIEPIYFLQDTWCAGKIATLRPESHVDVGSAIRAMALIAQFIPVTFVDIRRVDIPVRNLSFLQGSILELPFENQSLQSLSSLCVIEHIGLGRYGDPLDAQGSEKAAAELVRVLWRGGDLYISLPVDDICRVYFNAHRAFTREYVLKLFSELRLVDESYIYGRSLTPEYRPAAGFGTGLYHFRRQ